jgi:hypothetical protein
MTHESHHLEEPTNEERRLMSRRSALRLLGGAGLAVIAACATDGAVTSTTAAPTGTSTSASAGTTATTTFGGAGTCVLIPEETEGPYPLDLSGDEEFFRSDITEGRPGVPLTLTLSLST